MDFFEEVTALGVPAKEAANWMLGDMMRRLKEEELEPKDMRLTPTTLVKLIGIAYICEFAASISKDAGYSAVASQIELLGKLTMLVVSLPVFMQVVQTVLSLIN